MAGHWRPLYLRFAKGGKTVATAGGRHLRARARRRRLLRRRLARHLPARPLLVGRLDRRCASAAGLHLGLRRRLACDHLRSARRGCGPAAAQGRTCAVSSTAPRAGSASGGQPAREAAVLALLAAAALVRIGRDGGRRVDWCGAASTADLLPQAVPGPSVHLVYAYPSDGVDRLTQFGTTIQTDAETIDAWWRGQDPTRTPRFDTFAFSCGPQLDISDIKLLNTGSRAAADRRDASTGSPKRSRAAGLASQFEDYLVYYDGLDDGDDICGQGGTIDPNRGRLVRHRLHEARASRCRLRDGRARDDPRAGGGDAPCPERVPCTQRRPRLRLEAAT